MAVKISIPVALGFVLWRIRNKSREFIDYSLRIILTNSKVV